LASLPSDSSLSSLYYRDSQSLRTVYRAYYEDLYLFSRSLITSFYFSISLDVPS